MLIGTVVRTHGCCYRGENCSDCEKAKRVISSFSLLFLCSTECAFTSSTSTSSSTVLEFIPRFRPLCSTYRLSTGGNGHKTQKPFFGSASSTTFPPVVICIRSPATRPPTKRPTSIWRSSLGILVNQAQRHAPIKHVCLNQCALRGGSSRV